MNFTVKYKGNEYVVIDPFRSNIEKGDLIFMSDTSSPDFGVHICKMIHLEGDIVEVEDYKGFDRFVCCKLQLIK